MGKTYQVRPSSLLGLKTEWGAWQFDELCAIVGARVESNLMQGKPAFDGLMEPISPEDRGYRSAKHLVTKKVTINSDGTW